MHREANCEEVQGHKLQYHPVNARGRQTLTNSNRLSGARTTGWELKAMRKNRKTAQEPNKVM